MNTAFRSIVFEKDKSLLRAWLLVLAINIPAITLLTDIGFLNPSTAPLFWPALLIGGFIFGFGMVIAGGCASGTYYRAGRGMLGSWAALGGFLLGSAAIDGGIFSPVQRALRAPVLNIDGETATLFNLTGLESGIGRWILVVLVLIPIIIYLLKAPEQKFLIGWSWQKTGVIIGVLALAVWVLSAFVGRDFGLSFTQPSSALARLLVSGDGSGVGLPLYILLGVPLGSYLSAWTKGEARWSAPEPAGMVRQGFGGLAMGLGAGLAGGCNIGHGISGLGSLGIGSMLGVFSIMLGCWAMTFIVVQQETRKAAAIAAG